MMIKTVNSTAAILPPGFMFFRWGWLKKFCWRTFLPSLLIADVPIAAVTFSRPGAALWRILSRFTLISAVIVIWLSVSGYFSTLNFRSTSMLPTGPKILRTSGGDGILRWGGFSCLLSIFLWGESLQ